MKKLCNSDDCENEAVVMLTLTGMDSVVVHDALLCHDHAAGVIEFHPDEKDRPLSILNI